MFLAFRIFQITFILPKTKLLFNLNVFSFIYLFNLPFVLFSIAYMRTQF